MKLSTTIRNAAFLAMLTPTSATPYPVRTLYQFADNATWIENVAVRPNGNLLVTLLAPSADLYEIVLSNNHPSSGPSASNTTTTTGTTAVEARLVRRFAAYEGLTGIAETAPDVFAVLAGNYSDPSTASWSLWEADFTSSSSSSSSSAAINELVPSIPNALVLNGMTTTAPLLQRDDGVQLLISDSTAGHVLRVTTAAAADDDDDIAVYLADDPTTSPPNASLPTGVNGVRYLPDSSSSSSSSGDGGYLYFTNTYRALFCRVRIDDDDDDDGNDEAVAAAAKVEVLAEGVKGDDFAVRWEEGSGGVVAYVTDGVDGEVVRVVVGGRSGEEEKKDVLVEGEKATSAAFGRGPGDGDVLYVVTRGGKVLAVDLGGS
ncbi:minichromosome maintenance protein 5 [Diplodia seriata]|uniref:Minichromosome maintenance protein 5 n=1 Tax=Diplodia seriata TaxID=420778 RepID=A0A1S8BHU6_9PEZI|nr:hypothetical protein BK809_0007105 [Diplodia seriata]